MVIPTWKTCYFQASENIMTKLLCSSARKRKARRIIRGNLGFSFVKLEAIIELKLEFYSSIHFNCSELLRVPAKLYPIKAAVTHQPVLFSFSSSLLWLLGWWRSDPRLLKKIRLDFRNISSFWVKRLYQLWKKSKKPIAFRMRNSQSSFLLFFVALTPRMVTVRSKVIKKD